MPVREQWIAFLTLLRKETSRILRIWQQTLLPPAITMVLYFIIFGHVIGGRVGQMEGFDYMQFIVPGLIMMSVITNSYGNVVSSFFGTKFSRSIEELVVSPTPHYVVILGFAFGGVIRGLSVGLVVTVLSLFFTRLEVQHPVTTLVVVFLTSVMFSLAGFTNAVFARTFDDISIIPTFVLTPLTYLGGVFYSIRLLPEFWQNLSLANPILYMVNGFRFGILGVSDIAPWISVLMILGFIVLFFFFNLYLMKKGVGVRE
jgi:ABC-2 type transport system permease protein